MEQEDKVEAVTKKNPSVLKHNTLHPSCNLTFTRKTAWMLTMEVAVRKEDTHSHQVENRKQACTSSLENTPSQPLPQSQSKSSSISNLISLSYMQAMPPMVPTKTVTSYVRGRAGSAIFRSGSPSDGYSLQTDIGR